MKPREYQGKKKQQNLAECLFRACENKWTEESPVEEEQNGNLIKKFTLSHGCQPSCCQPGRIWDVVQALTSERAFQAYILPLVHYARGLSRTANPSFCFSGLGEVFHPDLMSHRGTPFSTQRLAHSRLRFKSVLQREPALFLSLGIFVYWRDGRRTN